MGIMWRQERTTWCHDYVNIRKENGITFRVEAGPWARQAESGYPHGPQLPVSSVTFPICAEDTT